MGHVCAGLTYVQVHLCFQSTSRSCVQVGYGPYCQIPVHPFGKWAGWVCNLKPMSTFRLGPWRLCILCYLFFHFPLNLDNNSHKLPKSLTVTSRLGIESKSLFFLPNNGLGVEVIFVGYMHMVHVQKVWNTNGPNKTPAGSRPKCMSRLNRLGSGPDLQPIDSLMQNGGSYTLSRKDHNMPVCTIIISSFGPVNTRCIFGPWAISSPHSLWTVWWIKMAVTFSLKKGHG